METLKFLMVSTHYPPHHLGGDAVFVDYLSKELVMRGHEVHVLHNPSVYEVIRDNANQKRGNSSENGVLTHAYDPRLRRTDALNALMLGLCRRQKAMAKRLAESIRPDVVHWHNTRAFIGKPFILGNEIPLYTSHDYGVVCPRSNLLRPDLQMCVHPDKCVLCCLKWKKPPQLWRTMSRRVLDIPSNMSVIAPSEFVANRLMTDGISNVSVLRNFVPDPGPIMPEERDTRSLIYLGMLERHKGLHTLVNAFKKSADRQEFVLDIVGTGSLVSEIRQAVKHVGLKDRIRMHGFLRRDDAEKLRQRADAQVVPSEWYENCPLTILEAFSRGVPVIGSDSGGIPEIVGPESGSTVFRCRDVDSLAEAITRTWEGGIDSQSIRAKARNTYESRFRPGVHINGYMRLVSRSSRPDF